MQYTRPASHGSPLPPFAPPPSPPPRPPSICENTCLSASNGVCEDGSEQSVPHSVCDWGTDCDDCGWHNYAPAGPPPPSFPDGLLASDSGSFRVVRRYLPSGRGWFKPGANELKVRSTCGLRAVGGVSLGWQTHWYGPLPLPLATPTHTLLFSSLKSEERDSSFALQPGVDASTAAPPSFPPGTKVKVRFYATNAAGLASYNDSVPITLDATPPDYPRQAAPCHASRYQLPADTSPPDTTQREAWPGSEGEHWPRTLLGCFVDDGSHAFASITAPIVSPLRVGRGGLTVEACAAHCTDYRYMALQDGDWCFCGDSYQTAAPYAKVDDDECGAAATNLLCAVRNGCGGTLRNAVHRLPTPVTWNVPEESPTLDVCWSSGFSHDVHARPPGSDGLAHLRYAGHPHHEFADPESGVTRLELRVARWGALQSDGSTILWGTTHGVWGGVRNPSDKITSSGKWYFCAECDASLLGADAVAVIDVRKVSKGCALCLTNGNVAKISMRAINGAALASAWASTVVAIDVVPPDPSQAGVAFCVPAFRECVDDAHTGRDGLRIQHETELIRISVAGFHDTHGSGIWYCTAHFRRDALPNITGVRSAVPEEILLVHNLTSCDQV